MTLNLTLTLTLLAERVSRSFIKVQEEIDSAMVKYDTDGSGSLEFSE